MTKLIDRMKPSYLAELKDLENEYPLTIKGCIDEMSQKYFWTDLSYSTIGILVYYLGINDFNPSGISQLFEKE